MKNLHSRLAAYSVYPLVVAAAQSAFASIWPGLALAAETLPEAAGSGVGLMPLGLAALAGILLGAGLSWLYLRGKNGEAEAGQKMASHGHAEPEMNAANSLTAGFIHEFNNTLCTIQGFTDLAILRSDGQASERQGLEQIRIGVQRSTRLLEQLERFHMEAETVQPLPVGILLKGYGKYLQAAATEDAARQKQHQASLAVQVQDTATLVLARPVEMQRLLALLHQVAMAVKKGTAAEVVQLVLRQAYTDRAHTRNPKLELVLQGLSGVPAASRAELEQLALELGGTLSVSTKEDGSTFCCLSLPGQPASVSVH